mmetsp:Transcript_14121/g.35893  ORF Transcript_14121/g.35893 Transcript_14121/m.35893 type:complete len:203 (-) Transcript_14121:5-613(-)
MRGLLRVEQPPLCAVHDLRKAVGVEMEGDTAAVGSDAERECRVVSHRVRIRAHEPLHWCRVAWQWILRKKRLQLLAVLAKEIVDFVRASTVLLPGYIVHRIEVITQEHLLPTIRMSICRRQRHIEVAVRAGQLRNGSDRPESRARDRSGVGDHDGPVAPPIFGVERGAGDVGWLLSHVARAASAQHSSGEQHRVRRAQHTTR